MWESIIKQILLYAVSAFVSRFTYHKIKDAGTGYWNKLPQLSLDNKHRPVRICSPFEQMENDILNHEKILSIFKELEQNQILTTCITLKIDQE